jgi:hypothetical protein
MDHAIRQTAPERAERLLQRLRNQLSHLQGEVTKLKSDLRIWLCRAIDAESRLEAIPEIPET